MEPRIEFDRQLTVALNDFGPDLLDAVMLFFSKVWVWIPLYAAAVAFFFFRMERRKATVLTLMALLAVLITDQGTVRMKNTTGRLRPCEDPTLELLISPLEGHGSLYGFPSGHACNSFCFAALTSATVRRRWWSLLLFGWAAIVTFSRIYVGKHFVGDCLAGTLLGIATGLCLAALTAWILRLWKQPSPVDIR